MSGPGILENLGLIGDESVEFDAELAGGVSAGIRAHRAEGPLKSAHQRAALAGETGQPSAG